MSMSGALAYRPDGTEAALVFQMRKGAYNDESLIEFLEEFHTHFAGERDPLIWDSFRPSGSRPRSSWTAPPGTTTGACRASNSPHL